ncbi:MAG: hypothetical protein LBU45_00255 [Azoarcus sp.]|jgi:hypothetical protein|nr:hypothetical protein [Azoarcus sp.]
MKPATLINRAAALWNRFSPAERHQIVGAACFLIALCYGLLIWMPGNKQLGDLTYKEQKQNARARTSDKAGDALKGFSFDSLDVAATREELTRARKSLAALETERNRLLGRFVPLEDLETLQSLKSELTRLAERGDMEITALEHIYRRKEDRDRPPTLELLKDASEGNPYKRPLLRLKARASYRGLMAFLDGLSKLSKAAAPVWSDIGVKIEDAGKHGSPPGGPGNTFSSPKQWLEVEIHLAI